MTDDTRPHPGTSPLATPQRGPASAFGIGGRLGFAFSLSALLSVVACIVGWLSYERLSHSIQQIGKDDLPATISAGQLAQLGGAIIASAPALSQAETTEDVARAGQRIEERLAEMRAILSASPRDDLRRVQQLVGPFTTNLAAIRANTLEAIAMRRQNEALVRELRALHSDFVDEAEPLVEDARFIVQSHLEDIEQRRAGSAAAAEIAQQMRKAEAILQISSHSNLAIGLVSRIASVTTAENLAVDEHFLIETVDLIRGQLPRIEGASDTITLRQILQRLFEIADPQTGLIGLRKREVEQRQKMEGLLADNRRIVAELDRELGAVLSAVSARASQSGEIAAQSIQLGRNSLLLIAVIAVLAALVIGIFYVRSSLIVRIRTLSDTARALSEGRIPAPVPVSGSDELTDMARAMERFRLTQDQLVQSAKLAALGNLSAGIAHEINQPLNAIRSHAHNAIILQERGDGAGLKRSLGKIESLVTRTAQVIAHLRRFSRRSDIALAAVAVEEVVDGAILLLGGRIRDTQAAIERQIAPGLFAQAEEIRLEQVMVNLLSNALDAIADRPQGRVRIAASEAAGVVRIEVIDNGPGIAPAIAGNLFDPFVTSKAAGGGMGLGLTISYNIIRDFGGTLRALPDAAGGHFTIELRSAAGGPVP